MNIYEYKKDGKTLYKFHIRVGKFTTTRQGFKTKLDAMRGYTKAFEELSKKKEKSEKITYYEVFEKWVNVYETTVKRSTFFRVIKTFEHYIFPYFEKKYITEITPIECQDFAMSLVKFTKGKETFNQAKRVLDFAIKMQMLDKNPFNSVILPQFKKKRVMIDYMEPKDVNKLLDYISDDLYWYTVFRVLIYTGIRRGELLALTWEDVDFKKNIIRINKSLSIGDDFKVFLSTTKTEKSTREILTDNKTMLSLKKLKLQSTSNIIFCNSKGNYRRLSDVQDKLNKLCKELNLKKHRVHDLRHTHASLLFASGATAKEVQERLGHTDIKTTMNIYTHVTKDNTKKAVDDFVEYMKKYV